MDLYERSALAYDVIQRARGRDCGAQAEALLSEASERRGGAPMSLLDVACGTGLHLLAFQRHVTNVAGVDLSPSMLARARALLPNANLHHRDMRTFTLDRTFDVITCLFSSIGYLLTVDDVRIAIANMARHLNDDGLLFVEPWLRPDQWRVGHRTAEAATESDVAVTRLSVTDRHGHLSTFSLYWSIATDEGVEQWVETHEMGLYTIDEYADAFAAVDLDVDFEPEGLIGRGMFIARRQSR